MDRQVFIELVANALCNNRCELFVGSGVSAQAGFSTWKELLRPLAKSYGFDVDKTDDLPLIAQYIENESVGNRSVLTQLVSNTFGSHCKPVSLHSTIANMGFKRIWTTNYDCLLEDAIRPSSNVLVIKKDLDLKQVRRSDETCVVKLHGSSDELDHVILTANDYDTFFSTHPLMAQELGAALSGQCILFIGYSYHDPDIRSIMAESRTLLNGTQTHFMILKGPEKKSKDKKREDYELRIHKAWVKELARLGIHVLEIDRYKDLESVLQEIAFRARGLSVFVTGSHDEPLERDHVSRVTKKLHELGATLVYGQSSGVGLAYFNSFCEEAVSRGVDIAECTRIYGNPYGMDSGLTGDPDLIPNFKRMRNRLLRDTKVALMYPGGIGTIAELELAVEYRCRILPVITRKKDYKNPATKRILGEDRCIKQLKEFCRPYLKQLEKRSVPKANDLLEAMCSMVTK